MGPLKGSGWGVSDCLACALTAMDRISSETPIPAETMSIFESCGSMGNSAMRRPSFVSSPLSLSAESA